MGAARCDGASVGHAGGVLPRAGMGALQACKTLQVIKVDPGMFNPRPPIQGYYPPPIFFPVGL